jgi:hypothetical protein
MLAFGLALAELAFLFYGMHQETLGDSRWLIASVATAVFVIPIFIIIDPGEGDTAGFGGGK